MKLVDLENPVRASWFTDQGLRLDANPYVSETYAARMTLARMPHTERLGDLADRIFRPGIFKRHWTRDRAHGVPFLSSADIFESDLSSMPMITEKSFDSDPKLPLTPGWTLITCSGMTAGRVTYARQEMAGFACTQDVLRVVSGHRIAAGYLYTFLASKYGTAMIRGGVYGSSIKHIEPPHLVDIPVPRLGELVESEIDSRIQRAMTLRSRYQEGVVSATEDLFRSAGIADLLGLDWHSARDTGFVTTGLSETSIRALNFSPKAAALIQRLRSVEHTTLGDICAGGHLKRGARFKRHDADPSNGVRLVGQRQAFWMRPEGRWVNPVKAPGEFPQSDETVLVAAHGTLGENEVYSRSVLVTGRWLQYAYSEDFLRVRTGPGELSGAYLFAALRSEAMFRILRSMSVGGKQQEYHPRLLRDLPIPLCPVPDRERITETVRRAYRYRDEADILEDEAMALLERAIGEGIR